MARKSATAEVPFAVPLWPAAKTELWPLAKITPYENNTRTHPAEQVTLLAKLMQKHGVDQPIVVDEAGVILKGHGRRLAAIEAGFEEFPVAVHRGLSEIDKRALRIEDNQIGLLSSYDDRLLRIEMSELKANGYEMPLLGFGDDQLTDILAWGSPLSEMPLLSSDDRAPFQQLTLTLHDTQVATLAEALKAAKAMGDFSGPNENGNGNALARVCEKFLESNGRS